MNSKKQERPIKPLERWYIDKVKERDSKEKTSLKDLFQDFDKYTQEIKMLKNKNLEL